MRVTCGLGLKSLGNVIAMLVVDTGFWLRLQLGLLIESSTGYKQVTVVGPRYHGKKQRLFALNRRGINEFAGILQKSSQYLFSLSYCNEVKLTNLHPLLLCPHKEEYWSVLATLSRNMVKFFDYIWTNSGSSATNQYDNFFFLSALFLSKAN